MASEPSTGGSKSAYDSEERSYKLTANAAGFD